jgi:hypothetical protein
LGFVDRVGIGRQRPHDSDSKLLADYNLRVSSYYEKVCIQIVNSDIVVWCLQFVESSGTEQSISIVTCGFDRDRFCGFDGNQKAQRA